MEKSDLRKEFNKIFKVEPEYYIDTGGRFEICGNHISLLLNDNRSYGG